MAPLHVATRAFRAFHMMRDTGVVHFADVVEKLGIALIAKV